MKQFLLGSQRRVGATVGVVLAVGLVLVIVPASVGSANPSAAKAGKITKVEIVGPTGTPLVGGGTSLAVTVAEPAAPVHLVVQNLPTGPAEPLLSLNSATTLSISDVAVACTSCLPASANQVLVGVYDSTASDCSSIAPGTQIAQFTLDASEPTAEFTFPTPIAAPVGLKSFPTGAWTLCAGAGIAPGLSVYVQVDGSQN